MARKKNQKRRSISQAQKHRQQSKPLPTQQAKAAATAATDRPTDRTLAFSGLDNLLTDDALLLTIPQTCSLLNLSRSTLDRMAKINAIPGRIKIGGQIRYHRPTLETWLVTQLIS